MEGRSNRPRIVGAARKLLAEEGYDRMTMKQLAREAGVAQGLIHYYFSGKAEILLEVLMEASREYAGERVSRRPEWYRLRYELFAMGLRNP